MYTLESFCNAVWGMPPVAVKNCIQKNEYQSFSIPKKNGYRTINYLNEDSGLFLLQKKLLKLLEKQDLPVCVKGFVKGENYFSYLAEHISAKYFLRIDIQSFFPSVTEQMIVDAFDDVISAQNDNEKKSIIKLISDITTLDGCLPQGACTSPIVSNIVMSRLDQRILKYCQLFGIRYSRYADDMIFSSHEFNFKKKPWFLKKVKYILSDKGLNLNYSKIKYGTDELRLNGYIISRTGIRLSRSRMTDIRHITSYVSQNYKTLRRGSPEQFLAGINKLDLRYRELKAEPFNSVFQLTQYMCGQRAFLISLIKNNDCSDTFRKSLQHTINKIETQIYNIT